MRRYRDWRFKWPTGAIVLTGTGHVLGLPEMVRHVTESIETIPSFLTVILTWFHENWFAWDAFVLGTSVVLIAWWLRKPSSQLSIRFVPERSPFYVTFDQDGWSWQRCRVRVVNRDKAGAIDNVCLKIVSIDPQPNALYANPVPLHFTNDHKKPYDESRLFAEQQAEFFDVVSLRSRDGSMTEALSGKPDRHLHIEHVIEEANRIVPLESYSIILEASGTEEFPRRERFYVSIDNRGHLLMKAEPRWQRIKQYLCGRC